MTLFIPLFLDPRIPTPISIWYVPFRFWMRDDLVEVWNVGDLSEEERERIASTSNALERYNRRLNDKIGLHPNLVVFSNLLEEVSSCCT